MKRKSLSVLIITRNRRRDILQCLTCLKRQTLLPDQLVLVEDTTEAQHWTQFKLDSFFNNKIQCQYISTSQGNYAKSRNLALQAASGDILVFLDDDVLFKPQLLKTFFYLHQRFPHIFAFVGKVRPVYPTPAAIFSSLQMNEEIWYAKQMIELPTFALPAIAVKKNVVDHESLYFDENLRTGEDILFLQQYTQKGYTLAFHPKLEVHHKFVTNIVQLIAKQYHYARDFGQLYRRGAHIEYLHYFPKNKKEWLTWPLFVLKRAHYHAKHYVVTFKLPRFYYAYGLIVSIIKQLAVFLSPEGRHRLKQNFLAVFA